MPRILLPIAAILLAGLLASCGATANAERIPVAVTIVDATTSAPVNATIYADGQRVALDVSEYTLNLPGDGRQHLVRVEAPGYEIWTVKIAGELRPGRRITGPVRLKRLPPGGSQASLTPAFAIAWLST